MSGLDSIPLPDTVPHPQGPSAAPAGKHPKKSIKLVRYNVSKLSQVPLPSTPAPPPLPTTPPPLPDKHLVPPLRQNNDKKTETIATTNSKHYESTQSTDQKNTNISNGGTRKDITSDGELADIKRSLMQKERHVEGPMEQSIVDEMFKDFLASKMQQIETEYKIKTQSEKVSAVDGQVNSVEEMNKLLDEELNTINQNTPIKKIQKDGRKPAKTGSIKTKDARSENVSQKSGDVSLDSHSKKSSKWDVKVKTEKAEAKEKSKTSRKSEKGKTKNRNKKTAPSDKVVDIMGSKFPSFQVSLTVNTSSGTCPDSVPNKNTEKESVVTEQAVDSADNKDSLKGQVLQGKKSVGKLQIPFKINVSKTSAELISSGVPEKELARMKALEEGEVLSSTGDASDTNNEESEDDFDKDNEISETGSISDSDKESKSSKSKKKKKKKKGKHKKKKKHKSGKDKDKDGSREQKGSLKRKHRSKSRSKSPKKHKKSHSRSPSSRHSQRSRSPSYDRYGGKWVDRGFDAYAYRDTDRRRDRDKSWRDRDKDTHRSRSRSRSQEKEKSIKDLRVKIDKAKLREIAIKNALAMARTGQGPSVDITTIKAGGKSVDELTDFCKRISSKEKNRDDYLSSSDSESEGEKSDEKDDTFIHHPFKVRDAGSAIVMNIRNAKALPVMTPQEKVVENSKLRLQFPVSSGSTHRLKESEWVPVEKTKAATTAAKATPTTTVATTTANNISTTAAVTAGVTTAVSATTAAEAAKEISEAAKIPVQNPPLDALPPQPPPEDRIFPDPPAVPIDIGSIISERLNAVRKLQENPRDLEAMSSIAKAQKKASMWAQSKQLPGQFTGSTGAQILSQDELIGPNKKRQAWAKKDQFVNATPLSGGIGMALLQKMGWKQGTGLGKNNEGSLEPLALDFKTDRKGLTSHEENPRGRTVHVAAKVTKDLSGKHPVSALVELCNKRKWGAPDFQLVHESGPDHKKNFLFKVMVNKTEYQPSVASNNKKLAKASAAAACLQELGLIPRT